MRPKPVMMLLREGLADLEEIALVGDLQDQFLHVVGLVGIFRHQRVERQLFARRRIVGRPARRLVAVVERQEIIKPAHFLDADDVVLIGAVGDGGFVVWTFAPPSCSGVTSSCVTVFTTSGPVMNM